jgi:hypothetical protein
MKTRQNKRTQARKSQLSRRRGGSRRRGRSGGSYYPYNNKPMIFTNLSNRQQGGDARDTFFPSFLTNMGRDAAYQVGQTYNAFAGNYPSTNPHPTTQNLFRR